MKIDEDDEPVAVFDVLSAMAESLVESQSHYYVEAVPDIEPSKFSVAIKPPREIFYRNTLTYSTKIPRAVQPRRCTCKYLCTGAPAILKCFSCAVFDPTQQGFFCDLCFKARHPWYRVSHIFTEIEEDEGVEYTLKVSNRKAEAQRYETESREILSKVQVGKEKLKVIADDEKVDNGLRDVGRMITRLEQKMRTIRHELREDIRLKDTSLSSQKDRLSKYSDLPINDDEAAVIIQKIFSGYAIRRAISKLYLNRIVRIWDATLGRDFYYDRITQQSTWTVPRFLMRMDIDKLDYFEDQSPLPIWFAKAIRRGKRRCSQKITEGQQGAVIISCFFRNIVARKRILRKCKEVYRKVLDTDSQTQYYYNMMNGHSEWTKPKIFLLDEPPLMNVQKDERINPLFNRLDVAS